VAILNISTGHVPNIENLLPIEISIEIKEDQWFNYIGNLSL
jgi:hypothetical protein